MSKNLHHNYKVKSIANLDHLPKVKGCAYSDELTLEKLFTAYATTGFQASNLAQARDIINIMRREQATIFLGCTSNMISSGLREAVTYLMKAQQVHAFVTTAGGIEEDIIKLFKPFLLGSFEAGGEHLFEHGINRTGNIFVPNDRYLEFDKFMQNFLKQLHEKYPGKAIPSHLFTKELGLAAAALDRCEDSYLYWAAQHDIPVICPALMDGAIGDLIHFFRQQHPDFTIDAAEDMDIMIKLALNAKKSGAIILGAGIVKHYILNANIFREGLDYCVYINTSQEFDGSDSGARIEEAITWAKVKPRTPAVKVHCDATIAFPLLMATTFAQ